MLAGDCVVLVFSTAIVDFAVVVVVVVVAVVVAAVVVGSSVCKVQAFTVHVAAPQHKAVYAVGHAYIYCVHIYIYGQTVRAVFGNGR